MLPWTVMKSVKNEGSRPGWRDQMHINEIAAFMLPSLFFVSLLLSFNLRTVEMTKLLFNYLFPLLSEVIIHDLFHVDLEDIQRYTKIRQIREGPVDCDRRWVVPMWVLKVSSYTLAQLYLAKLLASTSVWMGSCFLESLCEFLPTLSSLPHQSFFWEFPDFYKGHQLKSLKVVHRNPTRELSLHPFWLVSTFVILDLMFSMSFWYFKMQRDFDITLSQYK